MKKLLLIAGMHRSGTSFLSHLLAELGFQLPSNMGEGSSDNPEGFFEPTKIVELHDELLLSCGLMWDSVEFMPEEWFGSKECQNYLEKLNVLIKEEYSSEKLILIKDPRISKLIPFWKLLSEKYGYELKFIISEREPHSIATSLLNRNGIPIEKGMALSLSYLLNIKKDLGNVDFSRLRFPNYTYDLESEMKRVSCEIGIPELIEGYVFHKDSLDKIFKADMVHSKGISSKVDDIYSSCLDNSNDKAIKSLITMIELYSKKSELAELRKNVLDFQVPDYKIVPHIYQTINELKLEIVKLTNNIDELEVNNKKLEADKSILFNENNRLIERIEYLQDLSPSSVYKKSKSVLRLLYNKSKLVIKRNYIKSYKITGVVTRKLLPLKLVDKILSALPKIMRPHISHYEPSVANVKSEGYPVIDDKAMKNIFVLSIIDWDFRIQRPQHISKYLSKLGYRVFYIEMTQQEAFSFKEIEDNLYRVRFGHHGETLKPYGGIASKKMLNLWLTQFKELCSKLGTGQKELIIQHPFWWQFAKHISHEVRITFDCMDDIASFSNTDKHVIEWEHEMIEHCDNITVSSDYLKRKLLRDSTLIRNATELEHFSNIPATKGQIVEELDNTILNEKSNTIHIGYVGALDYWFDWKLVENVARARSNVFFHIAGNVTHDEINNLNSLVNVKFYGEISYDCVPIFNSKMDILTIPFKIVPIIEACDPVKIYEYSAVGKPTISTRLPELSRVENLVFFASTPNEYIEQIDTIKSYSRGDDLRHKLIEFSKENTWLTRAKQFKNVIDRYEKVSIIILSYKKVDLTIKCLESLVKDGGNYPNMEIIVVDNNSGKETIATLKAYIESNNTTIKLIENKENYGFAKGNNIGIEEATGEYILLLNNDTYASAGAILGMKNQFLVNKNAGVVGCLTNNIGNEAKVNITYGDMDMMQGVSRDAVFGYRNVGSRISVVAYFAVMFKKETLNHVGLISEEYGRGMFEDDDHCNQFKKHGYDIILSEGSFIHHELSATFNELGHEKVELFNNNKSIYESKWGKWLGHQHRKQRPTSSIEAWGK